MTSFHISDCVDVVVRRGGGAGHVDAVSTWGTSSSVGFSELLTSCTGGVDQAAAVTMFGGV